MKGRPPKPLEVLKLTGQFRADRHGDRADPETSGKPIKPVFTINGAFDEIASGHWEAVVPLLNWATEADSPGLQAMCEMWSLYQRALAAVFGAPVDKDARIAALSYKSAWESLAGKFGLTPADRARIKADKPKAKGIQARKRAG